jgi:hypothetical protein
MADEDLSKNSELVVSSIVDEDNEVFPEDKKATRLSRTNDNEDGPTSEMVKESADSTKDDDSGGTEDIDPEDPKGAGDEDPQEGYGQQSACNNTVSMYGCDRETVWTLAQMLTPDDREKVAAWLTKLDGCEDLEVRSQYITFLLNVTASGSLRSEPFQQLPPIGPLRRLGEVIDPVLLFGLTLSPSVCTVKPPTAHPTIGPPEISPTREAFFARNPVPEDGTFCYAVAFSDFDKR